MKTPTLIVLILITLAVAGLRADDRIVIGGLDGIDPVSPARIYPVKLALSGGGARGLSSIGVLKAFEEKNIRVTAIAGTSIGGVVGGLYACGYTPDELISLIEQIEFSDLFSNQPPRSSMFLTQRQSRERHLLTIRFDGLTPYFPQGLTAGQKLTELLTRLTVRANYLAGGDFLQLPIPFTTVCTDIISGDMVVISEGSLADAMRATMAFPLAFTGVETGGQILMDGGMVAPVPVSVLHEMQDTVTFTVAINTSSPLMPEEELTTPIDIANQVTSIMTSDRLKEELAAADYVIVPPIDQYGLMDFRDKQQIIDLGYRCGLAAADSIIALIRLRSDTVRYSVGQVTIDSPPGFDWAPFRAALQNCCLTRRDLIERLKAACRDMQVFRLEARVTTPEPPSAAEAAPGAVSLSVAVTPLLPPRETNIVFTGNRILSDSLLRGCFQFADSAITPAMIKTGMSRVEKLYYDRGYDLAQIRSAALDFPRREITMHIDEAVIERIDVQHNDVTRDWLVRSYFPLHVGEPYSTEKASEGVANIYGTDLFNRVTVDLLRHGNGGAIIKIGVDERKHMQARLGWHWDDAYQSEEFLEWLNDDALGIGLEYLLHLQYANDRQEYYGQLRANRIFATYLTARSRVFFNLLDRSVFAGDGSIIGVREERKWGGVLLIGQQIARLGTVTGGLRIEELKYENLQTRAEERFGLRSLILESQLETFDQWTFPRSGSRHSLQLQIAGKFLGGGRDFTKFFSSYEAYLPLGGYLNYHPRISIGLSSAALPASEMYYLGGLHSFSGYRTFQLSGDKMFLLNQELRIRLPLRFYLYGRYDIGEVYQSADQIKLRNLRHGVGVSIAFDSPIGPFEFGYGRAGDDQERYYFQAGYDF